jgi:hypothetical protein
LGVAAEGGAVSIAGNFKVGDKVYQIKRGSVIEGTVVNQEWIGDGANAVDWGQGATTMPAYATREDAQLTLDSQNNKETADREKRAGEKQRQLNLIADAEKSSPNSTFPGKMKASINRYGHLTSAQQSALEKIRDKAKFKPAKHGTTRSSGDNKSIDVYISGIGWVPQEESHEYE